MARKTLCLTTSPVAETRISTLTTLTLDNPNGDPMFICFLLEDGFRKKKVPGETRIPNGQYEVRPYRAGKFYRRYKEKYGHEFVPILWDVDNFTAILIHIGNDHEDTRGCLLTGMGSTFDPNGNQFKVVNSTDAYLRLYKILHKAFSEGRKVVIDVGR